MEFVLDLYRKLPRNEQIIFKDLLNDFLIIEKVKEENKGKVSIKQKKLDENNNNFIKEFDNLIGKASEMFENLDEDKQKEIEDEITKEMEDFFPLQKSNNTLFPIYKGKEINKENNLLFSFRRDFIDLLAQEKIIIISKFNLTEQFLKMENGEYEEELESLVKIKDEKVNELKEQYGEDIINEEINILKISKKKLEFINYDIEIIKEMLNRFETIDIKKIRYENRTLFYNGNMYTPQKDSIRDLFIQLFFNNYGDSYSVKEIINHFENGIEGFYDEKYRKKILDLYQKLNKTIERKLGIKDLFYKNKNDSIIYVKSKFEF